VVQFRLEWAKLFKTESIEA